MIVEGSSASKSRLKIWDKILSINHIKYEDIKDLDSLISHSVDLLPQITLDVHGTKKFDQIEELKTGMKCGSLLIIKYLFPS